MAKCSPRLESGPSYWFNAQAAQTIEDLFGPRRNVWDFKTEATARATNTELKLSGKAYVQKTRQYMPMFPSSTNPWITSKAIGAWTPEATPGIMISCLDDCVIVAHPTPSQNWGQSKDDVDLGRWAFGFAYDKWLLAADTVQIDVRLAAEWSQNPAATGSLGFQITPGGIGLQGNLNLEHLSE